VDGAAKLSTFAFGTSSNQASNEVTNQLTQSGSMTPVKGDTSQWTKAEAMSAVSHLLYYAKVRLSRESESLSGDSQVISMTEMIDITLSRLDLLRRLILLTGIDRARSVSIPSHLTIPAILTTAHREDKNGLRHKLPFNLDLNALNDAVKARQLRDELIDEDRMDEAIEVANKCNVEREPVWAAWGLSLLKMGKYEQAKEKFKYSLSKYRTLSRNFAQFLRSPSRTTPRDRSAASEPSTVDAHH
jgi:tetratricopeptide (TPR) repeat protein